MSSIITTILLALLLPLVYKYLIRVAPVPDREFTRPMEDMRRDYTSWQIIGTIAVILLIIPGVVLWLFIFIQLAKWRVSSLSSAQYEYTTSWFSLLLPAMFLGVLTSLFVMLWLYRRMLGDRYEEYMHFCDLSLKYDQRKYLPLMTWCTVIMSLVLLLPLLNTYILFTDAAVHFNRLVRLTEQRYGYDQVTEIAHVLKSRAPSGKVHDKPYFLVTFEDGVCWSPKNTLAFVTNQYREDTIQFLLTKTGLQLVEYEFAP